MYSKYFELNSLGWVYKKLRMRNEYFNYYYELTNSYPLVTTKELLYPGAFISEGIINEWALLKTTKQCKIAAGESYYKNKPKSGKNGAQNLFTFGWN